jgi:hypothetical protein
MKNTPKEATMLDDTAGALRFSHKRNISVGTGRVLWAPGTTDVSGTVHEAGWVLPGGRRTTDEGVARAAAQTLSDLASASGA